MSALKYGRRPPKRAPMLKLGPLLTGIVPEHPVAADYLAELDGGWEMLGNDVAGDCVAVTWSNIRRLVTTILGGRGYYPTQAQVWEIYRTQNPDFDPDGTADTNGPGSSADSGMDIQTLLEYLTSTPGPDGVKAVAFAGVDPANPAEVKAAIAIFGYVWTGINVLSVNQQQFAENEPWDYDPSSPVEGGHSVVTGGYGTPGTGALGGDERFITWAQETSFTDTFWASEVEEAWVVLWPEVLGSKAFLEGISIVQLAADYKALTGKELPAIPAPAPSPAPHRGVTVFGFIENEIKALWAKFGAKATEDIRPLVTAAEADLKALVAQYGPEAEAAVETRVAQLLTDLELYLSRGGGGF
jgi:hypothetical protein